MTGAPLRGLLRIMVLQQVRQAPALLLLTALAAALGAATVLPGRAQLPEAMPIDGACKTTRYSCEPSPCPGWLERLGTEVDAEEANTHLRFVRREIRVRGARSHCIAPLVHEEEARRLTDLGFAAPMMVDVEVLPWDGPEERAGPAGLALAALGGSHPALGTGAFLGLLAAVSCVPRWRGSGLLEAMLATTAGRRWIATAAWIEGMFYAGLGVVGGLAGGWLAGGGRLVDPHLVPTLALIVAVATAAGSVAERGAEMTGSSIVVGLVELGGLGIAAVAMLVHPGLAALVPVGGGLFAGSGQLGPWSWLADVVSVLSTGAVLLVATRLLTARPFAAIGSAREARRSRGNWLPEIVGITGLCTTSAVITLMGMVGDGRPANMLVVPLVLCVVPALLAPRVWGLDATMPVGTLRPIEAIATVAVAVAGGWGFHLLLPQENMAQLFSIQPPRPAWLLTMVLLEPIGRALMLRGLLWRLLEDRGAVVVVVGHTLLAAPSFGFVPQAGLLVGACAGLGLLRWRSGGIALPLVADISFRAAVAGFVLLV